LISIKEMSSNAENLKIVENDSVEDNSVNDQVVENVVGSVIENSSDLQRDVGLILIFVKNS
jgi:hypothetical protein